MSRQHFSTWLLRDPGSFHLVAVLSLRAVSLLSARSRQKENSQLGRGKCLEEHMQVCGPGQEVVCILPPFIFHWVALSHMATSNCKRERGM